MWFSSNLSSLFVLRLSSDGKKPKTDFFVLLLWSVEMFSSLLLTIGVTKSHKKAKKISWFKCICFLCLLLLLAVIFAASVSLWSCRISDARGQLLAQFLLKTQLSPVNGCNCHFCKRWSYIWDYASPRLKSISLQGRHRAEIRIFAAGILYS